MDIDSASVCFLIGRPIGEDPGILERSRRRVFCRHEEANSRGKQTLIVNFFCSLKAERDHHQLLDDLESLVSCSGIPARCTWNAHFIINIYISLFFLNFPLSMMYPFSTLQNRCTGCPGTLFLLKRRSLANINDTKRCPYIRTHS